MTEKEKKLIEEGYKAGPETFSCGDCKDFINPSDCKGCPIYCQGFSDD